MNDPTGFNIIKQFPNWSDIQFNVNKWNSQFVESNVIINTRSSDVYFPAHWTPLSIKCAFGGAEYYTTDKMKFRVDDRCFLVLNEGRLYESYINSETPVESFTICFSPAFVESVIFSRMNNSDKMLDRSAKCRDRISAGFVFEETLFRHEASLFLLFQNLRLSIHKNKYDNFAFGEILRIILDNLISLNKHFLAGSQNVDKMKSSTRTELFKRLNISKDYIDSCFNLQIELSEVAAASGLSEHYMLREFKKLFCVTPYQYLTDRRLEEAKSLLINSSNSISQISIQVGFEYLSSFSRLFTRRFNISPHKFRENRL